MPTDSACQSIFDSVRHYCGADTWPMLAETIHESPRRMEVAFYASEGYQSVNAMRGSGFLMTRVGDLAQILWFGPFSRKYVKDRNHGVPFLTSSSMMEVRPKAEKIVSRKHTGHLDKLIVRDGYILVSCSGTIGNVALCTKDVDGWACSQDAIRVVVNDPDDLGPVYCYLQSSLGQYLIKRAQTGSVVRHIYEEDVSILPLPKLPRRLRKELSDRIRKASALRVEANRLLDQAEEAVCVGSGLDLRQDCQSWAAEVTVAKRSDLENSGEYKGNLRLDYAPISPDAVAIRTTLISNPDVRQLRDLASEVIYIGKVFRIPVDDPERSSPLLSGKDLVMLRPVGDKLLSVLNARHIKRCLLHKGWLLLSRSGTPGRATIVHRNYEGFIGSEHILRIVPAPAKVNPYYLLAYLSSTIGQTLIESLVYGSVILTISKEQLESMPVFVPKDGGDSIGALVENAYDLRANAVLLEDSAIDLFLTTIKRGRAATEAEWGEEY